MVAVETDKKDYGGNDEGQDGVRRIRTASGPGSPWHADIYEHEIGGLSDGEKSSTVASRNTRHRIEISR